MQRMPMDAQSGGGSATTPATGGGTRRVPADSGKITPELVRAVADKVFVLMMRDLRIERERRRPTAMAAGRAFPRA